MDAAAVKKTIFEWKFSPMATYICPSFRATRNESNSPRGLAFLLSLTEGPQQRDFDPVMVERLYQCISCYLCTSLGYDDTDPALLFIHARGEAVKRDLAPSSVSGYRDRLLELSKRPFPADLQSKGKRATALVADPFIVAEFPAELRANLDLLTRLGADVELIDAPAGTGAQLFELGYRDEAAAAAGRLVEKIERGKYESIVFLSPYDFKAWSSWYTDLEVKRPEKLEVLSLPAYLAGLAGENKAHFKKRAVKVTYLDAGHFVRPNPSFENIASLLGLLPGVEFLPTWRSGRLADSDSGDFLSELYPQIATRVDEILLGSVQETGASVVLTSCFYALRNLRKLLTSAKGAGIEVVDLGAFLAQLLE